MNNLFSFATKELSQDAFLCWAINWMREAEKNTVLYNMGKSMLDLFLGDNAFNEYENVTVYRQYNRIDVLITFEHLQERYALIIEDKINSTEHSNQIQRYIDSLAEDKEMNVPVENISVAYVKTGIMYDADRRVKANIVTLSQLLNVLIKYVESTESQILSDYVEYLNAENSKREMIDKFIDEVKLDESLQTSDGDNGKKILATYYGQFSFLNTIFKDRDISKRIDVRKNGDDKPSYAYIDCIYAESNMDGTPWTEYCFWGEKYPSNVTDSKTAESYYLFWRVDSYTPRGKKDNKEVKYYISLRHYDASAHSKFEKANARKAEVYKQLWKVYVDIRKQHPEIIKEIGDRSTYKESDLIFISSENLDKIGDGTISSIQRFLVDITNRVRAVAESLDYNKKTTESETDGTL